jgi:hypothetical protein
MAAEDFGLIGFGVGMGMFAPYHKNYRKDTVDTTADGGRCARIDALIDNDGPWKAGTDGGSETGQAGNQAHVNQHGAQLSKWIHEHKKDHGHMSSRKHLHVSHHSAFGGSGLHQGHKEEE